MQNLQFKFKKVQTKMKVFVDVADLADNAEHNAARSGIFRATEAVVEALAEYSKLDIRPIHMGRLLAFQKLDLSPHGLDLLTGLDLGKSNFQKRSPAFRRASVFRYDRIYEALNAATDWERTIGSAKMLNRDRCLLHSTTLAAMPDKFTRKNVTRFLTIYDLTPVLFPKFFDGTLVVDWFFSLLKSIRPDDFVFCCSEATRRDLLNAMPYLNPDQVVVNYLAGAPFFKPTTNPSESKAALTKLGIGNRPFFLTTSTIEPRKNIPLLVNAFFDFARQNRNKEVCLVICGAPGWQYTQIMSQIVDKIPRSHRGQIYFVNHVGDSLLRELYRSCLGFIYPSTYEGFGLPILEAMMCGAPIVASNASSIPEVVGKAGISCAPSDRLGFSEALCKLSESTQLRRTLSKQSLIQSKNFTLQKLAERTERGYRLAH
jgi:glycosyltransferase involved in cell wall biosynthesis